MEGAFRWGRGPAVASQLPEMHRDSAGIPRIRIPWAAGGLSTSLPPDGGVEALAVVVVPPLVARGRLTGAGNAPRPQPAPTCRARSGRGVATTDRARDPSPTSLGHGGAAALTPGDSDECALITSEGTRVGPLRHQPVVAASWLRRPVQHLVVNHAFVKMFGGSSPRSSACIELQRQAALPPVEPQREGVLPGPLRRAVAEDVESLAPAVDLRGDPVEGP